MCITKNEAKYLHEKFNFLQKKLIEIVVGIKIEWDQEHREYEKTACVLVRIYQNLLPSHNSFLITHSRVGVEITFILYIF